MLGCKTREELELVKFNCSLETSKDKKTRPKENTTMQNATEDQPDTEISFPLPPLNLVYSCQ